MERPNRFVAICRVGNETLRVHVKNTGRCRELLIPGVTVYLEDFKGRMGSRKMRYSLIGVEKVTEGDTLMINMDSQAPNKAVSEALSDGTIKLPDMVDSLSVKAEKTFGDSRFDFYAEDEHGHKAFIEVKGVTLEHEGIANFPDAPTQRGVKHIKELIRAAESGYNAYIVFIIDAGNERVQAQ